MINRRLGLAVLAVLAVATGAPATRPASGQSRLTPVIVQTNRAIPAAAAAVRTAGGRVTHALPIVDGFAALVPDGSLDALRAVPGVRAVTPDIAVNVASTGDSGYSGSGINSTVEVGAWRLWSEGIDGAGVRVALVDTGVSPVGDLAGRLVPVADPMGSGNTVDCVNFSGESTCNDSYGHGTFIAGLIAGTGRASNGLYRGSAPGAQIVSVKLAGADGSADVTKVLAAIQWVVSFAPQYNIRVLNLSLGTDGRMSYLVDPLNYAVERAWRAGITVVVSASNRGPGAGTISKPGDDPLVVTVGAVDDRGTPAISDDRSPAFSGRGPTAADGLAKPDLVAPGVHVVSLRSPGSTVERLAPGGGPNTTYRRGSGTSMSTGTVSGVTALLLQANPGWTPDRVKYAMTATAHKVNNTNPMVSGAGLVDAYSAAHLTAPGLANQAIATLSDATGALDRTRNNVLVTATCLPFETLVDPQCDHVHGNETAEGGYFDPNAYQAEWSGSSWYLSQWVAGPQGSSWYGSSWYGSSWYGSSWYMTDDGTGGGGTPTYGVPIPGSLWYGVWS